MHTYYMYKNEMIIRLVMYSHSAILISHRQGEKRSVPRIIINIPLNHYKILVLDPYMIKQASYAAYDKLSFMVAYVAVVVVAVTAAFFHIY